MSQGERLVQTSVPRKRSLPASYLDGAVPIALPKNPSTPKDKSRRRSAPCVPLYTGPPIELDNENHAAPLPSSEYELST